MKSQDVCARVIVRHRHYLSVHSHDLTAEQASLRSRIGIPSLLERRDATRRLFMMRLSLLSPLLLLGAISPYAAAEGETKLHEKGRCAIRGHCGKQGFFGGNLPCPDNGKAAEPTDDVREKLVDICGNKWSDGPVCCEGQQVILS